VIPAIQCCRWIATPQEDLATLEVSAHLTVRPGQLEGFKKHVKLFSFVKGLHLL
jgi:hypothetical protein